MWDAGTQGRKEGREEGRKAGRTEVVHVGRAHRESNLSTLGSAEENVALISRLSQTSAADSWRDFCHHGNLSSAESVFKRRCIDEFLRETD